MRADANAMSNKNNLVLYLDKEIVAKSRALGFNLSRTFENHLKQLITQLSINQGTQNHFPAQNRASDMGLPGFEPGSIEPKSTSLDQTSRQPLAETAKIISLAS
jgi:hypothetical protein